MLPLRLAPNLVEHFYRGGGRIADLRGITTSSTHQPEEWLAATVARVGASPVGLASTVEGDVLRDLVAGDPRGWTGTDSGPDTGLLVKLIDAAQRLPVHVHPDRTFARDHLDSPYGKTEAWFVLETEPGASVHLGWTSAVDPAELARRRDAQDGAWMLQRMHRVPVRTGDGFLVPAGTPHAIGAGVLVAEVQEPTDFSILLEWSITTSRREESHLGLGFDTAMAAVAHRALSTQDLAALRTHVDLTARADHVVPCLPGAADPWFRLDLAAPIGRTTPTEAGFAVLLVLGGSGRAEGESGAVDLGPGEAWVVPASFGPWSVTGDVRLLLARPGAGWPASLHP